MRPTVYICSLLITVLTFTNNAYASGDILVLEDFSTDEVGKLPKDWQWSDDDKITKSMAYGDYSDIVVMKSAKANSGIKKIMELK